MSIAVASLALLGPWWVVNADGSVLALPFTRTYEYRPFGTTATVHWPTDNVTFTNTSDYRYAPNTAGTFGVAFTLTTIALASEVSMLGVGAISSLPAGLRKWEALCGTLAFVFGLSALLFVMVLLPGAVSRDFGATTAQSPMFWGSTSVPLPHGGETITYGAGWSWYTLLGADVLFLFAGVLLFRARTTSLGQVTREAAPPPG